MASASSASLRESAGGVLSGVQGQGPWAGGLGDGVPQKLITFSQLKDPKSLFQVTVCQRCDKLTNIAFNW